MKKIKLYIAGKVNPKSVFKTHNWRDDFCNEISNLSDIEIENLDPTKGKVNPANSKELFGYCSYLIKKSDIVIVNLTDDISIGGSQEMLIAKYFNKPLIGLAPIGGKFNVKEKIIQGKSYENYKNPFVEIPCDLFAENITDIVDYLKKFNENTPIKTLKIIDESIDYFENL